MPNVLTGTETGQRHIDLGLGLMYSIESWLSGHDHIDKGLEFLTL